MIVSPPLILFTNNNDIRSSKIQKKPFHSDNRNEKAFLNYFNTYPYFLSVLTGIIDFVKSTTEGDAIHKEEY